MIPGNTQQYTLQTCTPVYTSTHYKYKQQCALLYMYGNQTTRPADNSDHRGGLVGPYASTSRIV